MTHTPYIPFDYRYVFQRCNILRSVSFSLYLDSASALTPFPKNTCQSPVGSLSS